MIICSQLLDDIAGINHGFFTREGGCSTGVYAGLNCGFGSDDEYDNVEQNRNMVASQLGVESANLVTAYQIHSSRAVHVTGAFAAGKAPRADALVTATPGLGLGVLTADCAPVLFADSKANVIAAAHAGWQGALGGVLEAAIAQMEKLGAARGDITAVIGPAISFGAYQVGPEFWDAFMEADETSESFFRDDEVSGRYVFDLPGYVGARIEKSGIGKVENTCLCTYGEEARFFSYRRATHRGEADYGRQISAIAIVK